MVWDRQRWKTQFTQKMGRKKNCKTATVSGNRENQEKEEGKRGKKSGEGEMHLLLGCWPWILYSKKKNRLYSEQRPEVEGRRETKKRGKIQQISLFRNKTVGAGTANLPSDHSQGREEGWNSAKDTVRLSRKSRVTESDRKSNHRSAGSDVN